MSRTVEADLAANGGRLRRLPLLASAAPVAGALLSWDSSGFVHALVAGEPFAGVCLRSVRTGGYTANGDGCVDVMAGSFSLASTGAISGITDASVASSAMIYASDDSTFTTTASGNTKIGAVCGLEGSRVRISAVTSDIDGATDAALPTFPVGTIVGTTDVQTLSGKRITRRVVGLVDASTVTPNSDTTDLGLLLTLGQATLIANPTGTPTDGQMLELRIKSTSSRALTYGNQFRAGTDVALLSATTGSSKTDRLHFEWNAADSKWDIIKTTVGF